MLLPPEEVDEAKSVFAGLLEGPEPAITYERTWVGKDGSRRVIASSSIARRGADGAVRQIVGTGIDITQRKLAEDALRRSEDELRRLMANLFTAQEEERRRVARELHDDVNQRMAMLANEVATLEQTPTGSARLLRKQLRSLRKRVDQLSDDLRSAAHRLHPSALEHFGLVVAMESHCSDFMKLHRIRVKLTHRSVPESIPPEVSLCLYRATQECLHNVARHSGAGEARVTIRGDKSGIFLSVTDSGMGFDPGLVADQGGLGIVGIRERVRLVNGTVAINSQPGHGTRIEVRIPLAKSMAP
jgi:signal transduction histidine kinase